VSDNQAVRAGELLFALDPARYEQALAQAEADLALAQAQAQADAALASQAPTREALSEATQAATIAASDAAIDAASKAVSDAASKVASAAVVAAQARVKTARAQLEATRVTAPVSGYVTNPRVSEGDYARAGEVQLGLIDQASFWVTGYFKETDLQSIPIGAPVAVTLMADPGRPLRGEVESIAHGIARRNVTADASGLAEVSPTFEWIRLAQRIPVRIRLREQPADLPLRIGATASVAILPMPVVDAGVTGNPSTDSRP
jgi:multidrug resistance efflux pump